MAKSKTIGQEQKAAAVVVALGTEKASKLYKYLSAEEVEALTLEVAKLGHLQAEDTENILDDFYKNCLTQKVVTDGGVEYARAVLEKAYGEDMADELLRKRDAEAGLARCGRPRDNDDLLCHRRPQTMRLNCLSSSLRVSVTDTGRPCGQ